MDPVNGITPCLLASFSKAVACYADGGLKKDDLQVLEKSSTFLFVLHSPNSIAAPLFAPCSTQRLYLHEHPDFDGIDDVSHRMTFLSNATHHMLMPYHTEGRILTTNDGQKSMSKMQTSLLSHSGQPKQMPAAAPRGLLTCC